MSNTSFPAFPLVIDPAILKSTLEMLKFEESPLVGPCWLISTTQELVKKARQGGQNMLVVAMDIPDYPLPADMCLDSTSAILPSDVVALWYNAQVAYADQEVGPYIVLVGSTDSCQYAYHLLLGANPELILAERSKDHIAGKILVPKIDLIELEASKPIAYIMTERELYGFLKSTEISQETKILTTLVNIFPYIRKEISSRVILTSMSTRMKSQVAASSRSGFEQSSLVEGERLSLLTLHILGPAYSKIDRLPEQISKRTQAAAVQDNVSHYSASQMKDLISSVFWKADFSSGTVDEALGLVVCITKEGTFDRDLPVSGYASAEDLIAQGYLSQFGAKLLEQTRLVYMRFRSTSLSFVLPIWDQLKAQKDTVLRGCADEINKFEHIRDIVDTAPYMGMRAVLPEKYHIKNYAAIVYLGLVYHRLSLKSEEEKKAFADYQIGAIKAHIATRAKGDLVEQVALTLPTPTQSSMASLVSALDIEKAELIMNRLSSEDHKAVVDILRTAQTKGAWMLALIDRENAAYQQEVISKGIELMRKALTDQVDLVRDEIADIRDQALKEEAKSKLNKWRAAMNERLRNLAPWQNAIPAAPRFGQNALRTELVEKMSSIMKSITTFNLGAREEPME